MPPPPPNLFGRFGTARQLELQVIQAKQLQDAYKGARKEISATLGKEMIKAGATAKKTHAEIGAAIDMISKRLKTTTKNADEYGKALKRDTKAVMEFARRHNVSMQEAVAMYDKVRERQNAFFSGIMDKLKSWGSVTATAAAGLKVYRTRVDEIRKGHDLFLASTALTGDKSEEAWGKVQSSIDGYRDAMRAARDMTIKYGVSADEAKQTTEALFFTLRGAVDDASKLGEVVKKDTDRMYAFSKMMNIQVGDAVTYFRDQMRLQGKTHEEAVKSIDITIAGYDRMASSVSRMARPLKEDYFKVLQDIQSQYGPTQVSTQGMTAAMNMLAEAAGRAGLSAEGVKDAMGLLPKIGANLSRYHKIQLGRMVRTQDSLIKKLPEGLQKQIQAIRDDPDMMPFQKDEVIQELTAGTKVGIRAMFDLIQKGSITERQMMMSGLTAQQKVAFASLKKMKVGSKEFDEAIAQLEKGGKAVKAVRETMPQKLEKNTRGLDAVALKASKWEETTKKLLEQYQEATVPALAALTIALNAGQWYRAIGNLSASMGGLGGGAIGAAGKLGKFAGKIGVAGAALTLWYMALKKGAEKLDEWQTERLKKEQTQRSITREVSAAHTAKTYEERQAAIRGMLSTGTQEGVLTKEGKINYKFLQKKAVESVKVPIGTPQKIINAMRKKQVEEWSDKLKELTGEKKGPGGKAWFGGGAEVREAVKARDLFYAFMKENEQRRKEGRAELSRRKGETVKMAIEREKKESRLKSKDEQVKEEKARSKVAATAPTGRAMVTGAQLGPQREAGGPTAAAAGGGAAMGPTAEATAEGAPTVSYDPATKTAKVTQTVHLPMGDPAMQAAISEGAKTAMQKRGR